MIEEAKGLIEPGESDVNPDYSRGMAELIASLFPVRYQKIDATALQILAEMWPEVASDALRDLHYKKEEDDAGV